ncbi:MAG TPA: class II aldolase [Candidatus Hydrogenedentes bacterium]|nr:class II aldolase [Candidatus Hydrogenedentota bacterium]HIJ72657.1 class II aldolase [Candidatus Hydrogenedentota bacterium]
MRADVLQQLVAMSRYLGDPARAYAILGEGNTSARIDDDTFYVKASGTVLSDIGADGFVAVSLGKLTDILEDESAGDADVTEALETALVDPGERRRPSVETFLHAVLLRRREYAFVGHTHPTYTNTLLCSAKAEHAFAGRTCPDHIVVMGHKSVFVPYVDPGLVLAREVKSRIERFVAEEGVLPRAVMMQNHGMLAMGSSPKAVCGITDMAEKTSQMLVGAYSVGGPRFMAAEDVERIFTRPDEKYREKTIST